MTAYFLIKFLHIVGAAVLLADCAKGAAAAGVGYALGGRAGAFVGGIAIGWIFKSSSEMVPVGAMVVCAPLRMPYCLMPLTISVQLIAGRFQFRE